MLRLSKLAETRYHNKAERLKQLSFKLTVIKIRIIIVLELSNSFLNQEAMAT